MPFDTTGTAYATMTTTGTADVWPIWVSQTNVTSTTYTTTYTSTDNVWTNWCNDTTSTTITGTYDTGGTGTIVTPGSTEIVWREWCDPGNRVRVYQDHEYVPSVPAVAAERNVNEVRKKRRARALLRSILTPEQWSDWERFNSVRLVGASGDLYEVVDGYAYRLEGDIVTHKYCWHGVGGYCLEDRIAAIILKLRTQEDVFLRETHANNFQEHERERVLLRREGRRRARRSA